LSQNEGLREEEFVDFGLSPGFETAKKGFPPDVEALPFYFPKEMEGAEALRFKHLRNCATAKRVLAAGCHSYFIYTRDYRRVNPTKVPIRLLVNTLAAHFLQNRLPHEREPSRRRFLGGLPGAAVAPACGLC
jgi:hypothetical protein